MRSLHFHLFFIIQSSLTPKPVVAGVNWETQKMAFVPHATDRLPPPEKTQLVPVPSEINSDGAGCSPDLHENIKPGKVCVTPNTAKLLSMKALKTSELQCVLFRNVSGNHVVGTRSSLRHDGLIKTWSPFQSELTYLMVKVMRSLFEVVAMSLDLSFSLFKTLTPQTVVQVNSDRIQQTHSVSQVNVSYGHKMNVKDSLIYFDHQNVVILEDDPVVTESANFLFQKYYSLSTLLKYQKGALKVIKGSQTLLTRDSRVVLVGHGSTSSDGKARLGGYGPDEIAKVVAAMKLEDGHLQTISLVGCAVGRNLQFVVELLRVLRSLNVDTELHLRTSVVSISPDGEILTREQGVWRYNDGSKNIIAQLDQNSNLLTRNKGDNRGQVILNYQGQALYIQTLEWPTHPQMFVSEALRKKYTSIDCLEGLTWSLFFEEHERRRAHDYTPGQRNVTAVWLPGHKPMEDIPIKHITTILDMLVEIRYNAKEDADFDLYYVLNDCIFKVQKRTFYAFLVGKYIASNHLEEIKKFTDTFQDRAHYSLRELRKGLNASQFNDFCRQTFQLQHCVHDCEHWSHYFMAAVFTASVRNFHTFSLFLMTVIACEVSRSQDSDNTLCTAFVGEDHPMAEDDRWLEHSRRGFYGCAIAEAEEKMTKRITLEWLDQVVAKEDFLFTKSKQMMTGVDHDQKTELDIFGRVKVMNKYVFSSYLEFFRGTPEGKKLARGCRS